MKKTALILVIILIFFQFNIVAADSNLKTLPKTEKPELEHGSVSAETFELICLGEEPEGVESVYYNPNMMELHSSGASYYNFLNNVQKQAYSIIKQALADITTGVKITMPANFTESDLQEILEIMENDCPQYFWLANAWRYYYNYMNDVVTGVVLFSNYYTSEYELGCGYGEADKNEIAIKQSEINSNVNYFLEDTDGANEAQMVRIIHDNLIYSIRYNEDALNSIIPEAHSIYGVFARRTAVCEGYAKALKYLLNMKNIDCYVVTGTSDGINHAWNLVKVNGEWFEMDTTWDDPIPKIYDPEVHYENYYYFNITTELISKDHTRGSEKFKNMLPVAVTVKEASDYKFNRYDDFYVEDGVLIYYLGVGGIVSVPDNITSIDFFAFFFNYSLEEVLLPSSVKNIKYSAFYSNENLKYIKITAPNILIEEEAFLGCTNLTIKGYNSSNAQIYAQSYGIPFIALYDLKIGGKINSVTNDTKPATVKLYRNNVEIASVSTDISGNFTFNNLGNDNYKIIVTKKSYLSYTKSTVTVNSSDLILGNITLIPGDIDGNGQINVTDLSALLAKYNKSVVNDPADIDSNGQVNVTDLSALLSGYNKSNVIVP